MSEKIIVTTPKEPEAVTPGEPKGTENPIILSTESKETETAAVIDQPVDKDGISVSTAVGIAAAVVLLAVLAALLVKMFTKRKKGGTKEQDMQDYAENIKLQPPYTQTVIKTPNADTAGKVHNVGKRKGQQDSFGVVNIQRGVCAVVADGMGGLADGDKVSQKIVRTMMQDAMTIKDSPLEGAKLYSMAAHANREVNRMLGVSGQYKSGSTLIAVLTDGAYFQWISIGDSRIYLLRGNKLLQMNSEHIYERDLLLKAVNNKISFAEASADRQRDRLTSFIGMGELTHMDGSLHPVEVQAGDKLILMSDGVFNTLSDREIGQVLSESENAMQAAAVLERWVLGRNHPKQDNFTAVILEF